MCERVRNKSVFESTGVIMTGDLKVIYVTGGMQVERCMNQLELAELLKNEDVLLVSVNAPKVRTYRKRKKK